MQTIIAKYSRGTAVLRIIVISALAVLGAGVPAAWAEDYGVISANASDRPPVVAPDITSRSTDPDRPPSYGPEDAKVIIVLFSDYQCPACRRATQATHQIAAEFPGDVRIEVWHRPLAMHTKAEIAATAAVAAQRQGKFWEMHDMIFQNYGSYDLSDFENYALVLGLDMERFRSDMNDPAVRERIQAESSLAETFGIPATPGWLINGKASQGWGSWRSFRQKVEREVKEAKALASEGLDPAEIQTERAFANHADSATFELYQSRILAPNQQAQHN